jgi:hypothetical protein
MRRILSITLGLGLLAAMVPMETLCAATPSPPHACRCCDQEAGCCCNRPSQQRSAPEPASPQPRAGADHEGLVPAHDGFATGVIAAATPSPSITAAASAEGPRPYLSACSFRC